MKDIVVNHIGYNDDDAARGRSRLCFSNFAKPGALCGQASWIELIGARA